MTSQRFVSLGFVLLVLTQHSCRHRNFDSGSQVQARRTETSTIDPRDYRSLDQLRLKTVGLSAGEDAGCRTSRNSPGDYPGGDLFEIGARVPAGNSPQDGFGECIDTSIFRTVLTLTPAEREAWGFQIDQKMLYLANIKGINGFYVASIPVDAAEKAYYLVRGPKEATFGGHSEVLVKFAQPVLLKRQFPPMPSETHLTNELIFSFQGVGKEDANMLQVAMGKEKLVTASSVLHPAFKMDMYYNQLNEEAKLYPLKMTPAQLSAYIENFVAQAEKRRHKTRFNIFGEKDLITTDGFQFRFNDTVIDLVGDKGGNCTTGQIGLIEKVVKDQILRNEDVQKNFVDLINPIGSPKAFAARGFVDLEPSPLSWKDDFPEVTVTLESIKNGTYQGP